MGIESSFVLGAAEATAFNTLCCKTARGGGVICDGYLEKFGGDFVDNAP